MGKPGVLQSMRSQSQALLNNSGINDNEKIRALLYFAGSIFLPRGIWEWMSDWGRKGILHPWNVSECPPPRGHKHLDSEKPTSRGAASLGSQSSGPQAPTAGDAHTFGSVELPVRGPGPPKG